MKSRNKMVFNWTKALVVLMILVGVILFAGCGKKHTALSSPSSHSLVKTNYLYPHASAVSGRMSKEIDQSQVVAYASMDTNSFPNFVASVSEIWKGSSEAPTLGITNGTHFTFQWSATGGYSLPGGRFPDHAIVIIPHADSPSIALQRRTILFVYEGRTLGMTISEMRAKYGL
jgi:hypothetical protein